MAGKKGGRPKGRGPGSGTTEQERKFIDNYLKTGSKTQAAMAAGLPYEKARGRGHDMAKRPPVAAAIKAAQAEVTKETAFTIVAASNALDEMIGLAKGAKQFTAVANLLQTKIKMHGHLNDKVDVRHSGLSIQLLGFGPSEPPAIDVTPNKPALVQLEERVDEANEILDDGSDLIDE